MGLPISQRRAGEGPRGSAGGEPEHTVENVEVVLCAERARAVLRQERFSKHNVYGPQVKTELLRSIATCVHEKRAKCVVYYDHGWRWSGKPCGPCPAQTTRERSGMRKLGRPAYVGAWKPTARKCAPALGRRLGPPPCKPSKASIHATQLKSNKLLVGLCIVPL